MEDKKRGLVCHEVNNTVEFKGLVRVAKKNIPQEMVKFVVSQIRK
jgi:[lysine-biosynthesis-protein LysW]--L-2-aminoadipate ligase